METTVPVWRTMLTPFARASWVHEFRPNREIAASLVTIPAAGWVVGGARPSSDAARIDAGAKLAVLENLALFANATGEFSGRSTFYGVSGGLRGAW